MHIKDMKLRSKVLFGAALAGATIAGGGAAFAYFTNTGGTGSGTAGTTALATRSVSVSATETGLIYDGSASPITVTVSNTNPYSVHVASVGVTLDTASYPVACPTDSFQLTGATATGGWTLAATSGSQDVSGTLKIKFVDNALENQTGCIGITVPLATTNT